MIAGKPLNVHSVSDHFEVSRTAIYKHIKILTECGLIRVQQHGRERYCEARLDKLGEVSDWVEQYRTFWTAKLDELDDFLRVTDPVAGSHAASASGRAVTEPPVPGKTTSDPKKHS